MTVSDPRHDRLLTVLTEAGIRDERVLAAILRIPRDFFVPPTFREHAFENTALPIGQGQTISQPQVVGIMTEVLRLTDRHKVLEIGTGSGYQTAILALLCRRVYTIERHKSLLKEAEERLTQLGIANVVAKHGDGGIGWADQAPFDRIIVTAAAQQEVPRPLLEQLAVGGMMVVPVARNPIDQRLLLVSRTETEVEVQDLGAVRFVPLISDMLEPSPPQSVAEALSRLTAPRRS